MISTASRDIYSPLTRTDTAGGQLTAGDAKILPAASSAATVSCGESTARRMDIRRCGMGRRGRCTAADFTGGGQPSAERILVKSYSLFSGVAIITI